MVVVIVVQGPSPIPHCHPVVITNSTCNPHASSCSQWWSGCWEWVLGWHHCSLVLSSVLLIIVFPASLSLFHGPLSFPSPSSSLSTNNPASNSSQDWGAGSGLSVIILGPWYFLLLQTGYLLLWLGMRLLLQHVYNPKLMKTVLVERNNMKCT